jgi:hypothetical protein
MFVKVELIDFTIRTIGEEGRTRRIHFHVGEASETIDGLHIVVGHTEDTFGLGHVTRIEAGIGVTKIPDFDSTRERRRREDAKMLTDRLLPIGTGARI